VYAVALNRVGRFPYLSRRQSGKIIQFLSKT